MVRWHPVFILDTVGEGLHYRLFSSDLSLLLGMRVVQLGLHLYEDMTALQISSVHTLPFRLLLFFLCYFFVMLFILLPFPRIFLWE